MATPVISPDKAELDAVEYDDAGLVTAIVQDVDKLDIVMVAYMNAEALERTLAGPHVCFWSRSRQEYWVKGETSGNTLEVVDVRYDCDADCLLVLARVPGVACHTGERSCFYRRFGHGVDQTPTRPPFKS